MMNLIDKATEEQILDSLEERDPDLAEQIRQLMFIFDDLAKIDDRGMQEIIKAVKPEQWMLALKTASEAVSELVFKNMSERAANMLKEDMEAMGAVKLSDVESTQYEIVQITRKLEEEGKVVIAQGDAAFV
jgi:flagellar motor switch protein FliG